LGDDDDGNISSIFQFQGWSNFEAKILEGKKKKKKKLLTTTTTTTMVTYIH
jgi:hypothetical protein